MAEAFIVGTIIVLVIVALVAGAEYFKPRD